MIYMYKYVKGILYNMYKYYKYICILNDNNTIFSKYIIFTIL